MENLPENLPIDRAHCESAQAIRTLQPSLAAEIVARQYAHQAGHWEPFGRAAQEKSVRDAGYHLAYLAEALAAAEPSLFAEYVAWVKVLFAGLGFPDSALSATLSCTLDVLQDRLPAALHAPARAYVEAGLERLSVAPSDLPPCVRDDAPLGDLARAYIDALLQGRRHDAARSILDAVKRGVSVRDIYLHVFQPCQHEIGRLWQTHRISVAQEHYCTAATQLIMSQLYPYIFTGQPGGRRLVAACITGELHEIGMRMVADFFEMEGWDTCYLGANMPTEGILRTVEEQRAHVLAVSATMTFHVEQVAELIRRLRASAARRVKVLVGGYPFNVSPDLWRRLGADGCAADAQGAVAAAGRLVGA